MANLTFDLSRKNRVFSVATDEAKQQIDYVYKDIGTGNIHFEKDASGKEVIVDTDTANLNMAAIRESLSNLLHFRNGESILEPEFGISKIYEFIYRPYDKSVGERMLKTLKELLATWEPRINVISTPTTYDDSKHEYCITINYVVPALMVQDSYTFSIS